MKCDILKRFGAVLLTNRAKNMSFFEPQWDLSILSSALRHEEFISIFCKFIELMPEGYALGRTNRV